MTDFPARKVGIVACSGEELAEGTVTRLAALKVLHELRRGRTVTICLPLFLAGGEGERAFAKFHPTITVDGCDLKCAAHGTETYSGKPAASIVVSELAAEHGITGIEGRRLLNPAGREAVERTAERLAVLVDRLLGKENSPNAGCGDKKPADSGDSEAVVCSCASRIPAKVLSIGGQSVEVLGLPLIFDKLSKDRRPPDDAAARELLEMVKTFNDVPPEAEASWREVLVREFAAHLRGEAPR